MIVSKYRAAGSLQRNRKLCKNRPSRRGFRILRQRTWWTNKGALPASAPLGSHSTNSLDRCTGRDRVAGTIRHPPPPRPPPPPSHAFKLARGIGQRRQICRSRRDANCGAPWISKNRSCRRRVVATRRRNGSRRKSQFRVRLGVFRNRRLLSSIAANFAFVHRSVRHRHHKSKRGPRAVIVPFRWRDHRARQARQNSSSNRVPQQSLSTKVGLVGQCHSCWLRPRKVGRIRF